MKNHAASAWVETLVAVVGLEYFPRHHFSPLVCDHSAPVRILSWSPVGIVVLAVHYPNLEMNWVAVLLVCVLTSLTWLKERMLLNIAQICYYFFYCDHGEIIYNIELEFLQTYDHWLTLYVSFAWQWKVIITDTSNVFQLRKIFGLIFVKELKLFSNNSSFGLIFPICRSQSLFFSRQIWHMPLLKAQKRLCELRKDARLFSDHKKLGTTFSLSNEN